MRSPVNKSRRSEDFPFVDADAHSGGRARTERVHEVDTRALLLPDDGAMKKCARRIHQAFTSEEKMERLND
jgi:hypothetical protein